LFVGTLWITGIAMLVAGPIGLGVAIYLSEYASPASRRILKPLIETLASIPSVVIGFFAVSFISPQVLQPLFSSIGIFSLLAAGLGVGVLTVPIIASISEDAMRAVPSELREASYGLGSRPVTTALRVVFPSALSGITAAFIVGVSRAIGETMVVFIAAGGSGGAIFESDPTKPGQAITAAMASLGAGTDSVAGSGIAFQSLYFLGALLFVTTLILNLLSDLIVRRFRQAY
jgi:phosphate transport system permease protein